MILKLESYANKYELESSCTKTQAKDALSDTELESCANKHELESSCTKKQTKDALSDIELENNEIFSEVSNPNLSPRDNACSIQTISSQLAELVSNNQVASCENSSTCSGNSSSEESLNEEEESKNDTYGAVSTSLFVRKIPKDFSSTGIRKITFKFSKRKEDYDNQLSATVVGSGSDGISQWNHSASDDMNTEISSYGKVVDESNKAFLCQPNMELKMSKKVLPDSYPTTVKKLLSTGILEGARVKYVTTSQERELPGIIKGCGYLCGCSLCNFSKILSAYEFELHAGGKTRHPNNHIYLENGKPIYSVIQELKTAPHSVLDEVVKNVAGSSVNEESFQKISKKTVIWLKLRKDVTSCSWDASCYHKLGQMIEDNLCPTLSSYVQNYDFKQKNCMKEALEGKKKRVSKKPSFYHSSSVVKQKKNCRRSYQEKLKLILSILPLPGQVSQFSWDNDLHRLLFMPNGLLDGAELAYYSKGQISPSQFEAHAGWSARRQPYRNIYTSGELTLRDIALSLANGQNLATGSSDDMCAACGSGGDLIICDGCPRAFHAGCAPKGDWHCPYCRDKVGFGRKSAGESSNTGRHIIIRLTRVVKALKIEIGGCVVCSCEKEYHVGCLRDSGLCDLKELPRDKWFCCDDCNRIHVALQNLVLFGAEMIPASVSYAIHRKHVEKGFTNGVSNDVQWRILSGKSRYPEHLPILSRAATIFRECFDPIVATSGCDLIPVMVYGRNIFGQEFGGMYCVVLIVKSVVVSAGLLRIFGREVAELPLVATSRENQGKGYFQALFSCIDILLYSLNVKNLVLPVAEEAESIWTKKLGFRKMSDERLLKYTRNLQLMIFKGTSMLEKKVQQIAD
ncbi:unnamed protein product [Camellia sinensis]